MRRAHDFQTLQLRAETDLEAAATGFSTYLRDEI